MINWIKHVAPWKWRPVFHAGADWWFWHFGVQFYIDLALGFHFDRFRLDLAFGPLWLHVGVEANN